MAQSPSEHILASFATSSAMLMLTQVGAVMISDSIDLILVCATMYNYAISHYGDSGHLPVVIRSVFLSA